MWARIRQLPSEQTGCVCLCGECDNLTNVRHPLVPAHNRDKWDDVRQGALSNSSPFIRRVRAKVVFFMDRCCRLGQLADRWSALWACIHVQRHQARHATSNPKKGTHVSNSEADGFVRRFLLRGHFAHGAGEGCFPCWIKYSYGLRVCVGPTPKGRRNCVCMATWLIRGQRTRAR